MKKSYYLNYSPYEGEIEFKRNKNKVIFNIDNTNSFYTDSYIWLKAKGMVIINEKEYEYVLEFRDVKWNYNISEKENIENLFKIAIELIKNRLKKENVYIKFKNVEINYKIYECYNIY